MKLKDYITSIVFDGKKVLAIYLTAGFPDKKSFTKLALDILENGADILEIGLPFSDPLADGPIIQYSSTEALKNKVNTLEVIKYCEEIKKYTKKPIVIMTYANPVLAYGINNFYKDISNAGVDGVILPDVPLEEIKPFKSNSIDNILLAAPNSKIEKIMKIDEESKGFVYGVSVTGVTGERENLEKIAMENVKRLRKFIIRNKLLIGFGIKSKKTIQEFWEHCDGFIVGSAIISSLIEDNSGKKALEIVKDLKNV